MSPIGTLPLWTQRPLKQLRKSDLLFYMTIIILKTVIGYLKDITEPKSDTMPRYKLLKILKSIRNFVYIFSDQTIFAKTNRLNVECRCLLSNFKTTSFWLLRNVFSHNFVDVTIFYSTLRSEGLTNVLYQNTLWLLLQTRYILCT